MVKAISAFVTVALVGGLLVAGVWLTGGAAPGPTEIRQAGRTVSEPPEALVCGEAPRSPQIAANEAWPRTFAGFWIEQSEHTAYVAFTEGAEEKVARLAECFSDRSFTPITFERSLGELEGVFAEILADREAIRAGTMTLPGIPDHQYSFGIYMMRNVITVTMEGVTPETIETFTSRYGPFVEVEEGDPGGPD